MTTRQSARVFTHDGKTLTIREWSEETGLPISTILSRVGYNWPIERVLTQPYRPKVRRTDQ